MKTNQSFSLLDALILEPSFPPPHNRLVLDEIIDVRCGDIGYLTGFTKEHQFVCLGNILDSECFGSLALRNLDSENGVDLEPEDVWSISNDGQNRRYTLHLDRLQRDWVRIDIDHVQGHLPRRLKLHGLKVAWDYLRDNADAICKEHVDKHDLSPSDLIIVTDHRSTSKSSIMSCWTGWMEALQKHGLSVDARDIHFYEKEHNGMWGYWSVDGSSNFADSMNFHKDANGDWQGDDQDLAFIIRSGTRQHVSYIQLPL